MSENVPRPIRKIGIADHLWDALEQMAREMGSDREGLVNQALFMFARLNGFLVSSSPGAIRVAGGNGVRVSNEPTEAPPERTPAPAPQSPPRRPAPGRAAAPRDSDGPPQLAKSEGLRRTAEPAPPPPEAFEPEPPPPQSMDNDPARIAVAQRVLETAAELENLIKGNKQGDGAPQAPESTGVSGAPDASAEKSLFLSADGRELEKVVKDRYLIGRGKHCDLVINSGKVSREHAAIVRDGDDFFLQDLDSSNGTWFNKQRIKRRKIEDGDEYFICSDRVKFVYR